MTKEITITVYRFDELSESVKKRLIRKEVEYLQENWDTRDLTEEMKYKIEEAGFLCVVPYWSLSCCQGDGVAFKFNGIDDEKKFLEEDEVAKLPPNYEFHIQARIKGRYTHFNSMGWEDRWDVFYKDEEIPEEYQDKSSW